MVPFLQYTLKACYKRIRFSGLLLLLGLLLQPAHSEPSEAAARYSAANLGYESLKAGDQFYHEGDYARAVEQYQSALSSVKNVPSTAVLYQELTERYATAATEQSKSLRKVGKYDEARSLLEAVLSEEIAPGHPRVQRELAMLDDPIRTNPALNYEHVQNIEKVRQLLYTAEGAYNLGKYDQASAVYEEVLRIDPYNKAARRGMERTTHQKAEYGKSAEDETRAQMLAAVDAGWELQEQKEVDETLASVGLNSSFEEFGSGATVSSQIDSIIIPAIDFEGVDLREAIDFLRQQSRQHDNTTLDPLKKGVQFILRLEPEDPILQKRLRLKLTNVPLRTAIETVTSQAGVSYRYDEVGVVVSSSDALTSSVYVRSYSAAPDFLSRSGQSTSAESDPFGSIDNGNRLLGQRVSAKQVLEGYGVRFEEGASATFIASSNTLVVSNTEEEHQQISQILQNLAEETPTMVVLEVKLISIEQNSTDERGFEWSLESEIENLLLAGGAVGNGNALSLAGRPLTAGNRSGDRIYERDAIDDVITRIQGTNGTLFERFDPLQRASGINNGGRLADTQITSGRLTELQETANAPGIISSFVTLGDSHVLNTMLRGLQQSKGTDFISRPKVVTRSGQVAKVTTGREFIYPTEYDPPEISDALEEGEYDIDDDDEDLNYVIIDTDLDIVEIELGDEDYRPFGYSVTPSHPTAFETTVIGSELEVEPIVSSDKKTIQLNLKNIYRDFDGFINYGSPISVPIQTLNFDDGFLDSPAGEYIQSTLRGELPLIDEGEIVDGDDINFDAILFPAGDLPPIDEVFDRLLAYTNFSGINVEQVFFEASKNNILMPVFSKINTETSVTIADGATVVLGGLLKSKRIPYTDKTPILGSLPLIGKAFRSEGMKEVDKVVLLTVTARCIDPSGRPINQ